MATLVYDEDRLPWLDDTPFAETSQRFVSGAVARRLVLGSIAILACIILGTVLTSLLRPSVPAPVSSQPNATKAGGAPPLDHVSVDQCIRNCLSSVSHPELPGAVPAHEAIAPNNAGSLAAADGPLPDYPQDHPTTLQLGAYRSYADSERGWRYLSDRFPRTQSFGESVVPPLGGTDNLYRLRLTTPTYEEAQNLCTYIQRGDEECFLVP